MERAGRGARSSWAFRRAINRWQQEAPSLPSAAQGGCSRREHSPSFPKGFTHQESTASPHRDRIRGDWRQSRAAEMALQSNLLTCLQYICNRSITELKYGFHLSLLGSLLVWVGVLKRCRTMRERNSQTMSGYHLHQIKPQVLTHKGWNFGAAHYIIWPVCVFRRKMRLVLHENFNVH